MQAAQGSLTYSLGKCLTFQKCVYLFVAMDWFVALSLYLILKHLATVWFLFVFEMNN